MSAREGLDVWAAAWLAASPEVREAWQAAERGDPDISRLGVEGMMRDALRDRLRSGEWRATAFLHDDALEPEPVPPRWWREIWIVSGDVARGGGREVTALRILPGDGIEAEAPQPVRQAVAKPATKPPASMGSAMDKARARYLRHLADFRLDPADPKAMPPTEAASAAALPDMPRKVLRAVRREVWGDRATKRGPRR